MKKILSILMVLIITLTTVMCTDAPVSAAKDKRVSFGVSVVHGGLRVDIYNEDVEKWSVMYSKNRDSGYKGYKNIPGSKQSYEINNLEYGTKYYFYVTAVIDGKTVKSSIKERSTESFNNLKLGLTNQTDSGNVIVSWNWKLVPDSVSVYYSEKKNGKYTGYKNVKTSGSYGENYILTSLDFGKTYYIKLVLTHNGKKYSEIKSIKTADKPAAAISKKSQATDIIAKAIKEQQNSFYIYYKSKSLIMEEDEMIDRYSCFYSVEEEIYDKRDGSAYVKYNVRYKNYANIIFAYATGETEHLSKDAKKNLDILKKIIESEISDNFSDEEKVKAIHDYLVNNTDYDIGNYYRRTIPDSSYRITGPLQYNKSVCNGYTETFQLLMDMLKINSIDISGTANNGSGNGYNGHAWNLVEIDGKWYYIDVTWDDPTNVRMIRYDYYLVTESTLSRDHRWDKKGLPVSDGKKTYTDEQNKQFMKDNAPDWIYYDIGDVFYQGAF